MGASRWLAAKSGLVGAVSMASVANEDSSSFDLTFIAGLSPNLVAGVIPASPVHTGESRGLDLAIGVFTALPARAPWEVWEEPVAWAELRRNCAQPVACCRSPRRPAP